MSDTSMIRVNKELKLKLKDKAARQGRTLEWMTNDALSEYLVSKATIFGEPVNTPEGKRLMLDYINKQKHLVPDEPHYEPLDDTA